MKEISISKFKATCLAVLEDVKTTGQPIIVTKRGVPIAEVKPPPRKETLADRLGCMAGTVTIVGDITEPTSPEGWDAEIVKEWDELQAESEKKRS